MIEIQCTNLPTDRQLKQAKKFGEGFTWTCSSCGGQRILTQGKGDYWYWKPIYGN